ncbi:hypothetical protein [Micromonospora coxensis]|nr:hypothetical protein [Micromonospora coxensis]
MTDDTADALHVGGVSIPPNGPAAWRPWVRGWGDLGARAGWR